MEVIGYSPHADDEYRTVHRAARTSAYWTSARRDSRPLLAHAEIVRSRSFGDCFVPNADETQDQHLRLGAIELIVRRRRRAPTPQGRDHLQIEADDRGRSFFVAMVALSMAFAQFDLKSLRDQIREHGNQITPGVFTGGSVHCLVDVAGRTRREGENSFGSTSEPLTAETKHRQTLLPAPL